MTEIHVLKPGMAPLGPTVVDNRPPEEGPYKVRCYTPDRNSYHKVAGGTMIPRASDDRFTGRSPGSRRTPATLNVVEVTDEGDKQLAQTTVPAASASTRTPEPAMDTSLSQEEQIIRMYQGMGINVVPMGSSSESSAVPVSQFHEPVAEQPVSTQPYVPAPVTQTQPATTYPQPSPVQPDGLQQLAGLLASLIQAQQSPPQQAMPVVPQPAPPTAPPPVLQPEQPQAEEKSAEERLYTREQLLERVDGAVQAALDRLGIPGLRLEPQPPQFSVEFDLGQAGVISSRYHWVGQQGDGLLLFYDTRFQYGQVYTPPNLGETQITVRLPDHGRSFKCVSNSFVQSFGVFKIAIMVVVGELTQPKPVDSESSMADLPTERESQTLREILGVD